MRARIIQLVVRAVVFVVVFAGVFLLSRTLTANTMMMGALARGLVFAGLTVVWAFVFALLARMILNTIKEERALR